MAKALIFGANGQDGFYLNQQLRELNFDVIGISRHGNWINGDISDHSFVTAVIKKYCPGIVFNLAANSTTSHSALFENNATIGTGTLNLLESVKNYSPDTKIFISGSGLQFHNDGLPIKETDQFEATSPYAISRIQTTFAARYYRSLGIKAYVGYFFNHESPFRSERHMSKKIAAAAKRISNGSTEKLEIGDITVKKEWGFAGDIVSSILCLTSQNDIYEATLGTGVAYSIEEWLQTCFSLVDLNWQDHVITKENFIPEYNVLVSDPSTINSLGWTPEVSFKSLAKMMLADHV